MNDFSEVEIQGYLDMGMSSKEIAHIKNCSVASLIYWIKKHPTLTTYTKKTEAPGYSIRILSALRSSKSILGALKKLGMSGGTGNYQSVHSVCKREGLNAHDLLVKDIPSIKKETTKVSPDYFIENSSTLRKTIKRKIIKEGLIPYACSLCGLPPVWKGTTLTLILDHINGVYNDNRLSNLRFCCPNCNSQLDTHTGKNSFRSLNKYEKVCSRCSNRFTPCENGSLKTICAECAEDSRVASLKHKFSKEDLVKIKERLAAGDTYTNIGKTYGISDNAVRKRIRLAGETPPKKNKKHKIW